jgi:hypothetical protein
MTVNDRDTLIAAIDTTGAGGTTGEDVQDIADSAFITKSVTYTALTPTIDPTYGVIYLDGTSNTVAAALPTPASNVDRVLFVKATNIDNAVTLTGTIEGGSPYTFATVGDALVLHCDGTTWNIFSEYLNA